MEVSLNEKFIAKLEEKYGVWDKTTSRFGSTSFGAISRELSISASQFTKLVYGTATEGMYQRSIENINRLIQRESIREELQEALSINLQLEQKLSQQRTRVNQIYKWIVYGAAIILFLGAAILYFLGINQVDKTQDEVAYAHPLSTYFDQDFNANFNSPYLNISEVQDFCPCSAYEGVWSLSNSYKLPLPGSKRPGLYYLAKSADVRMKCSRYETINGENGSILVGYEYLVNEIWVDTKMTSLSPKYFDNESKTFTSEFEQLEFTENPQFKKVATIHSFFTDQFQIYPDSIVRKGEPCGRFASDIDEELATTYEIDIKYILENVLSNLTTTNCSATTNSFCDPNDLREKESIISFDCLYTINTENLGIGGGYPYQKGYRLEKQNYTDNLICVCEKEEVE